MFVKAVHTYNDCDVYVVYTPRIRNKKLTKQITEGNYTYYVQTHWNDFILFFEHQRTKQTDSSKARLRDVIVGVATRRP